MTKKEENEIESDLMFEYLIRATAYARYDRYNECASYNFFSKLIVLVIKTQVEILFLFRLQRAQPMIIIITTETIFLIVYFKRYHGFCVFTFNAMDECVCANACVDIFISYNTFSTTPPLMVEAILWAALTIDYRS